MSSIDFPQVIQSSSLQNSSSVRVPPHDVLSDILATPASQSRRHSLLSPTRISRFQEKVNLQELNDRLVAYIVKVQQLEVEKNHLSVQNTALQNSIYTEASSVRSSFEKQLADTLQILDETVREKAKFKLDAEYYKTVLDEQQTPIICERDELMKQVQDLQHQLKVELLARTDLENNNVMLKEELASIKQMYKKLMSETEVSKQAADISSEIDDCLQEDFLARLQSALQDFRNQYEAMMQQSRDEIVVLYRTMIQSLGDLAGSQDYTHLKVSDIAGLEMCSGMERSSHDAVVDGLQRESNRLRRQMIVQLADYQQWMDSSTALDLEIGAYGKLLEVEESRLNLISTSGSGSAQAGTPTQAVEQLSTKPEESSLNPEAGFITTTNTIGDVHVIQVDPEGKFVRVMNMGDKVVPLGGWQLVQSAKEVKTGTILSFHHTAKIAPGAQITVWSAGTGVATVEPTTFVMKEQSWLVASHMFTTLLNKSGEEVSKRERKPASAVRTGFWNQGCSIL